MADINILEGNEVVNTTGVSDINGNFEELNIKKIELVGLTTEMLDTDYFTIKKDDGKFYLITKADADLGGGTGTCGYTEAGNVVDLTFLNGSLTTSTDLDADGNFYIAKSTGNFDTQGEGIYILKIDSNFNIIQHSLIRYSPTVGFKGLGIAGLKVYNGELFLISNVHTSSLNPVPSGGTGYTACFIRIDKTNLNILGNTVIIKESGTYRYLTAQHVISGFGKIGLTVADQSQSFFCIYDGSFSVFSVNNSGGTRWLHNGITDFIGFLNDASVGQYKYYFLNTLAGLYYTTNIQFLKIVNDGTNYYAYNANRISKLNSNLEPLLAININLSGSEVIYDIIYNNNYIYVLSSINSSYGITNMYLHIFNSSDLTFYKKIQISTLLQTGVFAIYDNQNKLFIKDGYIYIFIDNYNTGVNLRIFKISLDPAIGDYLTQPAKKTNMYNMIVDQVYTPEAGSLLVKSNNTTLTHTNLLYMSGYLGLPGLSNTSGSISQIKLWIGI